MQFNELRPNFALAVRKKDAPANEKLEIIQRCAREINSTVAGRRVCVGGCDRAGAQIDAIKFKIYTRSM